MIFSLKDVQIAKVVQIQVNKMFKFLAFVLIWTLRLAIIVWALLLVVLLFRVIRWIANWLKIIYVYFRIEHIKRISLYPREQIYKKIHELTGYSIGYGCRGFREYYRVRNVPNGYARKVQVHFLNGFTLCIRLKENSQLYKAIMNHT